ncbi:hypothetical protein [Methylobacterium brachythecii]|uniref:hypothetical protein n=1 Tax=Methylobacterium brachythecii TaxID=1176177 RepID=UPI0024E128A1|nr:hypothetical protein [Methylobacterium brachythecii]
MGAAEGESPVPIKAAASATPNASDVLFDQPQMKNTPPGSTIRYVYTRRSGIARGPYGPPLDDEIKFKIDAGKSAESRDIQVQMFSGANRASAGPFDDMPGNPILPLFLENHMKGLAALLEANPRYIKNAIRKGLRDKATVTATKIDFKGRQVDGWTIVTKPFEGDPQTEKMRGFDGLTYTFVTSPEVPGEIVSIEAQAKKPDGGELLDEKVNYDQNAG